VNVPGKERVGYVGLPQAGVDQRIAEDGELQIKSPGMMMGYFKNKMATDEITSKSFYNLSFCCLSFIFLSLSNMSV